MDETAADVPKVGDQIYVRTSLHMSHGEDDVVGGLATVMAVSEGTSKGQPAVFVSVHEHPGYSYNWALLSQEQAALAAEFGTARAHEAPDHRPEFNDRYPQGE